MTSGSTPPGSAPTNAGFVAVDAQQRTTNPRVSAAGDVSGAPQYVYVAAQAGRVAAAGALGAVGGRSSRPARRHVHPPQLGGAGLTEEQALAAGPNCDCRVLDAQDIPRARANRDTRGALKLVVASPARSSVCTPRSTAPAT